MSSAVIELARSRELFRTLVERNLRLRAKRSWVGVVWPMIAPLFLLGLYYFVFKAIYKAPIERYGEFLFAALLPWTLLAQSLGHAVTSLSMEPELIRRARFPYELLPIASVVSMSVYFFATLAGFVAYLGIVGRLSLGLLPLVIVPCAALVLLVLSIAMSMALIDVYNRDLRAILGNLLTLWFFLVPIVYRHEMAPGSVRFLRSVDPMNLIVGQFRDILYWRHVSHPAHMALMVVICVALFGASLAVFRRFSPNLPKDV